MPRLTLQLIPGEFAVCRLSPTEPIPAWAGSAVFSSVTRTANELSIICPAVQVPAGVKHEAGWRVFKLQGLFLLNETGILASVLSPLAETGVTILTVGTFDTDYLLVKDTQREAAMQVLRLAGHGLQHTE